MFYNVNWNSRILLAAPNGDKALETEAETVKEAIRILNS